MQTDCSGGRRAWCGRRGPTLCNCAAFRSQWESVVGRSLSMTSYNHPTDFFFFNFKNYGSDGRLLSSLPSQMIRKTKTGQFLSIWLSNCTLYVNYTLALLKSKIPIDLNQPVTLLSLNPEVTKERIKKKNTHTTLTLTCHRKRIGREVSESTLQVTVYCSVLKENHAITFEVLGLCACIVQSRPRLEVYFHSQKHG